MLFGVVAFNVLRCLLAEDALKRGLGAVFGGTGTPIAPAVEFVVEERNVRGGDAAHEVALVVLFRTARAEHP